MRFHKVIKVKGGVIRFDMSKPEQLKRLATVMKKIADEVSSECDPDGHVDFRPFSQNVAEEFDRIFGKNATIKTFGTTTPSTEQWEEFCNKFSILVEKWIEEV